MGDAPRWFQLYWSTSRRARREPRRRAPRRAAAAAIVLTLDTTMLGWRIRDLDLAYLPVPARQGDRAVHERPGVPRGAAGDPARGAAAGRPDHARRDRHALGARRRVSRGRGSTNLRSGLARAAVQRFVETYSRPSLSWDDLAFLRERTRLPILLKGILHPEDARAAVEHGMDGIVVSNHGGRQVDGAIGTMDALPGIVEAVGGRVPVLLDSGVRSGADVFRALALGAAAVGLGRPYVWGLAAGGEDGVREVIRNLRADFDLTMGLAGCASVARDRPRLGPARLTDGRGRRRSRAARPLPERCLRRHRRRRRPEARADGRDRSSRSRSTRRSSASRVARGARCTSSCARRAAARSRCSRRARSGSRSTSRAASRRSRCGTGSATEEGAVGAPLLVGALGWLECALEQRGRRRDAHVLRLRGAEGRARRGRAAARPRPRRVPSA